MNNICFDVGFNSLILTVIYRVTLCSFCSRSLPNVNNGQGIFDKLRLISSIVRTKTSPECIRDNLSALVIAL